MKQEQVPTTAGASAKSMSRTNDYFVKRVFYEDIAELPRQCKFMPGPGRYVVIANAALSKSRESLTPEQIAKKKLNSECRKCGKWSHWHSDYLENGKLKPSTPSRDMQEDSSAHGSVSFNMADVEACSTYSSHKHFCLNLGLTLDDGAPCSGIGEQEFNLFQYKLNTSYNGSFDDLQSEIAYHSYWQYGSDNHDSQSRKIIGSIFINLKSGQGETIRIRQLIVQGPNQWIFGRSLTKHCNILQMNGNQLQIPTPTMFDEQMSIYLVSHDLHCYMPLYAFGIKPDSVEARCVIVTFAAKATEHSWPEIKAIIDKVHNHVCGHASLRDMQILLERNSLW